MSIVERFNRTLRGYIARRCKDGIWYKKLYAFVEAYNNKEGPFGETPNYLSDHPKTQKVIREVLIGKSIKPKLELDKFKVGDKVRYFKKRKLFGKGNGEYTSTVHEITDIRGNSIFLDGNDEKKYRYYNLIKVDKISKRVNIPDQEIRDKAKKNYKTALKLAKEQPQKISVKELDANLQKALNDETVGKGKRIKKANSKYT
jgi:hypothetical protein